MNSDSKRPKNVVFFKNSHVGIKSGSQQQESGGSDSYQLIALLFGVIAFIFRMKWGAWMALFFFFVSMVNMKFESDFKQLITSMGIVVVGFVSVYLAPNKPMAVIPETK